MLNISHNILYLMQEEEHTRAMKLRELNEENKSKSHGNVARSTSAYGDNKYVTGLNTFSNLSFFLRATMFLIHDLLVKDR